jgi:hypothetical protein
MNRNLASTLAVTATAAAALALAALASSKAYAEDITIDPTPFVSSKTRAEVRAELMGMSDAERRAYSSDVSIDPTPFVGTKTRAEVRAELMGMSDAERHAYDEGGMHWSQTAQPKSTFTRAEAKAQYLASRRVAR